MVIKIALTASTKEAPIPKAVKKLKGSTVENAGNKKARGLEARRLEALRLEARSAGSRARDSKARRLERLGFDTQ